MVVIDYGICCDMLGYADDILMPDFRLGQRQREPLGLGSPMVRSLASRIPGGTDFLHELAQATELRLQGREAGGNLWVPVAGLFALAIGNPVSVSGFRFR